MKPTQCICEKPYIAVGTEHCANCGGYPTEDTPNAPQSSNTGAIPSQSNNSGAMQQLREAIFKAAEVTYQPYTLNNPHPKQVVKIPLDDLMSLFTTAQIQLVSELEKQGGYAHAEALKTGSNQVATLNAKIEELQQLLEGDRTLGGSLLRVPDHPDDVRVVDVSSEWLADEMNYRPRRAIREWIETRIARYQEQVNDLITTGSSQDTVTPSRPGEHKKQELEKGK